MTKKKKRSLKFVLLEKDEVVEAILNDDYDHGFHHRILHMPAPRIRAPRLSKEDVLYFANVMTMNEAIETNREYLHRQLGVMSQEINKQVHEIRRILKRTQSMVHYLKCAEELIAEKGEDSDSGA